MAVWILLAIAAQFLSAIVALLDKYIVSDERVLPQPFVYAFYTCVLAGASIAVFMLSAVPVPLDGVAFPSLGNVVFPTLEVIALSILAAYTFFYALVSLFTALQKSDASDVVPVVGAVSAISSYGLGHLLLGDRLSSNFLIGAVLLAIGTALVSRYRFTLAVAFSSIHAGIFFALHYVVIKGLFETTSFDDGFFWSRIGFVVFGLSLLLVPSSFKLIFAQTMATGKRAGSLVIVNKIIAGFAGILILKATELGEVSIVQALGGLQYIFIFGFSLLLGPYGPNICSEGRCTPRELFHKAAFIAIITIGFFMLFW